MSMLTHGGDQTTHLKTLGTGRLPHPEGGPGAHLLEVFPNRFPGRPYIITFAYPEYTSLCPVTGQPDFGTIVLEYIPDERCVESKSFKLYMFSFRSHQTFMETLTNTILDDMVTVLDPLWCRVKGLFAPRGGTHIHVFAEHFKTLQEAALRHAVYRVVRNWKHEAAPHAWRD